MYSSDEDQDDSNIYDKLKSIRPFTLDQLYLLHPDLDCPLASRQNEGDQHQELDKEIYHDLYEYEKLRRRLSELRNQIKTLFTTAHEHVDMAWNLKEESTRKIAMCQHGKICEATIKYKQAFVNPKQLVSFSSTFSQLTETISKEYIYYSYESQMKRNRIATKLSIAYHIEDVELRRSKLKSTLTTLIEFIRHLSECKSSFASQCCGWFCALARRLLEENTTENYQLLVSLLSRGPAGTADWSHELIECKPFEQVSNFDSVPQYITHCSALLTELFNSLKHRIGQMGSTKSATTSMDDKSEEREEKIVRNTENWSIVDPRFSCTEELDLDSSLTLLSESDVIRFCCRIPIAQIFRSYVKKCLAHGDDETRVETDKNYEYIMLKLLTIGTIIIKTYQIGLETFNSIQYGSLIEYLSSQLRRTVIILSEKWTEFKNRLRGIDDALLMRLQVEYDNFILRSILIILELRQSGIWRHLSRVEQPDEASCEITGGNSEAAHQSWIGRDSLRNAFSKLSQAAGMSSQGFEEDQAEITPPNHSTKLPSKSFQLQSSPNSLTYEFSVEWFGEVSEPMLWHILWQFYHNAFISSCDYHSDNYWMEKFREKSVVYLFVNKVKDSPPGECSYLIKSITSMLLSRTRSESKLVFFIATEIFNLSFKYPALRQKITKIGIKSLVRSADKFPVLISLYLDLVSDLDQVLLDEEFGEHVIELVKASSFRGWICNQRELDLLSKWLIDYPTESSLNKVSRIVLTKILLNSTEAPQDSSECPVKSPGNLSRKTSVSVISGCSRNTSMLCVDLKMRRKLALLLYEASIRHLPEGSDFGPKSLGSLVEVGFCDLYSEKDSKLQYDLLQLAVDSRYKQFYLWIWRLIFWLKLHILNQPGTDWNDLKGRSGTSRSVRNTVLVDDSFHPTPSLQDSECLLLAEGLKIQNPMASFVYLMITDSTWQADKFDDCFIHMNNLVNLGYTTPSLLVMKFFTVCHLSDLEEIAVRNSKCLDYFNALVTNKFDATRVASLIMSQLDKLKQFRQLQLSQFYIHVFLEVAGILTRRISASWFSTDEVSLDGVARLLDYLVQFNFATQRMEIIHKFYDCAYVIKDSSPHQSGSGWLGSILVSNPTNADTTRREFITTLHALSQKFKAYFWLRWVTTECDTLRLEKIWEDIVSYLSGNETANLDSAIRRVCPQVNASLLKSILPINSWIRQIFDIMESELSHPLCPLIWYNFFLNYFANSLNGTSVGSKLVQQDTLITLKIRLDSLINYHLFKKQTSLAKLYLAYKQWIQDSSLRDAYVDMDRLSEDYLVPLLKTVMELSGSDACMQYIDLESVRLRNRDLMQVWLAVTRLNYDHSIKGMMFVESVADDSLLMLTNAEDSVSENASTEGHKIHSAEIKPKKSKNSTLASQAEDELRRPLRNSTPAPEDGDDSFDKIFELIRKNFNHVFEEANIFTMNINELGRTKSEIVELVKKLYKNKKREFVRVVRCRDGDECIGPARIRIEVEEATLDDRKSHCIQDRRRQCQELIGELIMMPRNRSISSTVIIEENLKRLVENPAESRRIIESLLSWIAEDVNFDHFSGNYHVANSLLKTTLEILSTSDQIDSYNISLLGICLKHPGYVQLFSPFLTPVACSNECFLQLYHMVTKERLNDIGPTATFVLLSKFDLNDWLEKLKPPNKQMFHDLIKATCSAFKSIGKNPDSSYDIVLDLFRRHLHTELALPDRREKGELFLVLDEFLTITSAQQLAPKLWTDFMMLMGFEIREKQSIKDGLSRTAAVSLGLIQNDGQQNQDQSLGYFAAIAMDGKQYDEVTIENFMNDVVRQAECQNLFDYESSTLLVQRVSQFMAQQLAITDKTLLELYADYLDIYSSFMLCITFVWIRSTSEKYPDNHELIWDQFMKIWYDWVFLERNCQNVAKSSYNIVATYFVASLRYMINKIPDNTQDILRSILHVLNKYVMQTREVVYLELSILQRCLKKLPWSNLMATQNEFENLYLLSTQEDYNISDLVSYIISQFDSRKSLAAIAEKDPDTIPEVAEKFATVIVLQSNHLKGYRLQAAYLSSIPVENIDQLSNLILSRMEFVNLEHNQNNKLLVNLLRYVCMKVSSATDLSAPSNQPHHQDHSTVSRDSYRRSLVYAQFVSKYLVDLIKRHPSVTKSNKQYIAAVVDNTLQDLKPLLLSSDLDLSQKTYIYEALMECCSSESLDFDQRLLLANLIIRSNLLKNKPLVVLEILHAIGQVLRDGRILVETLEEMIIIYLNMNGHYEKVWKSFCLKVLPSDIYLSVCVELQSPLALLVYFESLVRKGQVVDSDPTDGSDQTDAGNVASDLIKSTGSNSSTSSFSCNSNRIWSSFFHWLTQFVVSFASGNVNDNILISAKFASVLPRVLELLEPNLQRYIFSDMRSSSAPGRDSPSNDKEEDAKSTQLSEDQTSSAHTQSEADDVSTTASSLVKQLRRQKNIDLRAKLLPHHKCLLELIKQLNALYDSLNSGGIWSYLTNSGKSEHSNKLSLIVLAVSSFLVDRTIIQLSPIPDDEIPEHLLALRHELNKYRRACMVKFEAARKSKNFSNSIQFIETMIECSQRSIDKVQYMEGVLLITTYIRLSFSTSRKNVDFNQESSDLSQLYAASTSFDTYSTLLTNIISSEG